MSVPGTLIQIIGGVSLSNNYEHSLYFPSSTEQNNYFAGKVVKTFNQFTYLKPGNVIKVAGDVANARRWTYLRVLNGDGLWWYHFITKVVYLNDSAVELHVELDVLQTYLHQWTMKQCFIERTHTATDNIGEHTLDEGLETGPLVVHEKKDHMFDDMCVLILTAMDGDGNSAWSRVYDGVFSGLGVYAVELSDYAQLGTWLDTQSRAGKIDAIVSMWMYPKELVRVEGNWGNATLHRVLGGTTIDLVDVQDSLAGKIDGYTVKNNKMFTYPYTMLYVSNNMGGSAVYRRELFATPGDYSFKVMGALSPDAGVQLTPLSYGGTYANYDESLTVGAFPSCAWDSDTYKVWLAQNQNSQALTMTQAKIQAGVGALATVASIPTGNLTGALGGLAGAYNALTNVQGLMAQKADMEIQPPQARGAHSGNINVANDLCGFSFYTKTIRAEYARAIDRYFSRYGYKVNQVGTPSLKNRSRYTYIKTQGCHIGGDVGTEDRLKIQAIFDKGVTFWADHDTIGNYSADNNVL